MEHPTTEGPDDPPWSASGLRRAGEELASVVGRLSRADRSRARGLLQRAWALSESRSPDVPTCYAMGRDLEALIRRAWGNADVIRGWLDGGCYFTLRRKRPVRSPRGVDWARVERLESRGRFHQDRQTRHDWLWERCNERSGAGPGGGLEGGNARSEPPPAMELVWSEPTD